MTAPADPPAGPPAALTAALTADLPADLPAGPPVDLPAGPPADPPAGPAPARRTAVDLLARVVTEVLSPVVLVTATLVGVGALTGPGWRGPVDGLAAATFACILPFAVILVMVRRDRLTDHHVRVRSQRAVPLGVGIASTCCGIAVLVALHVPGELLAVTLTVLAGGVASLVVNLRWKASVHVAVVCCAVVVFTAVQGPWWLAASPLAVLAGWSRVRVRDHTVAQTVGGAVFGTVTSLVTVTVALHALGVA